MFSPVSPFSPSYICSWSVVMLYSLKFRFYKVRCKIIVFSACVIHAFFNKLACIGFWDVVWVGTVDPGDQVQ